MEKATAYPASATAQSTFYAYGDSPKAVAKALLEMLPDKDDVSRLTLYVNWSDEDRPWEGELFVVH